MNHTISRVLIETVVKKALRDIKDSPERSIRNLVDMALQFSNGRFQKEFFETTQTMLQNEDSAYYRLVRDAAYSVSEDRMLTFGVNLGYSSCTYGAKIIRATEANEYFNIPWSLSLGIDEASWSEHACRYQEVISEGETLGVYSWLLFADGCLIDLLSLAAQHPEHAFAMFCEPECITQKLMEEAETVHNIMFVVRYNEGAAEACQLLRENKHLYSVYLPYRETDVEGILSGELFCCTEPLHPAFTMLLADHSCSMLTQTMVYDYVVKSRKEHKHQTIPWDVVHDSRFVDGIISDDACAAGFNRNGALYTMEEHPSQGAYNLFTQPLAEILKTAFPKAGRA